MKEYEKNMAKLMAKKYAIKLVDGGTKRMTAQEITEDLGFSLKDYVVCLTTAGTIDVCEYKVTGEQVRALYAACSAKGYKMSDHLKRRYKVMGTWKEYIEGERAYWVGKVVHYKGKPYTVKDVDYNGALLIDLPARFTETTAINPSMTDEVKTHLIPSMPSMRR